ncbi:type VI secretion system protein [Oleiphilus messinensis]|uniref:Type VI secretion system protein n=1 Tax=Oleiphilus messinensis TaxID=141451 RepID=A0A1Y0IHJ3_9GAMM|nr:type IVB secretion system protein IcmH/DotU [Oleiphilus messinensis]ARU58854.1 type VI secretion system protein [Oleiphilus messinensis]
MRDNDKTIIGPGLGQSGRGDRTLVVPTPGRNQRQAPKRPTPGGDQRSGPRQYASQGMAQQTSSPISPSGDMGLTSSVQGLNKIAAAASELLALHGQLRGLNRHDDITGLRNELITGVKSFERELKEAETANEVVVSARYVLCSALDEAILNTPWGAQCGWAQHSLLSTFHNETFGGEKFFLILNRLLEAPARYIDALELLYLLLAQGFVGKYRLDPRGHAQLEQIKDNLYQTIARHRGEFERDLSPRWHGIEFKSKRVTEFIPLWVYASVFLFILVGVYAGFRYWQAQTTTPVAQQLLQIAQTPEENGSIVNSAIDETRSN